LLSVYQGDQKMPEFHPIANFAELPPTSDNFHKVALQVVASVNMMAGERARTEMVAGPSLMSCMKFDAFVDAGYAVVKHLGEAAKDLEAKAFSRALRKLESFEASFEVLKPHLAGAQTEDQKSLGEELVNFVKNSREAIVMQRLSIG